METSSILSRLIESFFEPFVQGGVKYLDREHPGWRDKVDLDRLDLSNGHRCVIGQVTGCYNHYFGQHEEVDPIALGFKVPLQMTPLGFGITEERLYMHLTNAWKRELTLAA